MNSCPVPFPFPHKMHQIGQKCAGTPKTTGRRLLRAGKSIRWTMTTSTDLARTPPGISRPDRERSADHAFRGRAGDRPQDARGRRGATLRPRGGDEFRQGRPPRSCRSGRGAAGPQASAAPMPCWSWPQGWRSPRTVNRNATGRPGCSTSRPAFPLPPKRSRAVPCDPAGRQGRKMLASPTRVVSRASPIAAHSIQSRPPPCGPLNPPPGLTTTRLFVFGDRICLTPTYVCVPMRGSMGSFLGSAAGRAIRTPPGG
jgi:hypothetical protein